MDVIVLIPNSNKELCFLLEKEGIKSSLSKKGTLVVTLKKNTKGAYTIPRTLLRYKKIIPAVNLIETSEDGFAQIICNPSNGSPLTPYHIRGKNAYFSIKRRAAIICATRNRAGIINISAKTIDIEQWNETIVIKEREINPIPEKFNNAIKAAIGKSRHPDNNTPYYVQKNK
jgi:hypothetical protein